MSDGIEQPILPESDEELQEFALRLYRENKKLHEENQQHKYAYKIKSREYERKSSEYEEKTRELKAKSQELETKYEIKVQEYLELHEKYELLRHAFFGRSSEKWPVDDRLQASLFNEAEIASDEQGAERAESQEIISYTRKKRGKRKPLPAALPREEIIHDIGEEEKLCGCGAQLVQIGEEVSEKLEVIPAQMKVIRHVRPKYACHECEGSGDEENPAVK
ncbi:MAG: IS66 family transposase zinc-finger binding domain-containing protein, partial [Spirochaetales bacterium]|nr:IS66 family transposase zinc-finger binding domain-containing protein [Spirochaetales bacterium]